MPKKQEISKTDLVEIALKLSAMQGWDMTRLSDIADEAGISLADLHDYFEDKSDILVALGRQIDRRVLDGAGTPDLSLSPREVLFDILMDRFEI